MFATYSNENIVQSGLRDLGCSIAFLVAVTEGSPCQSTVTQWVNGMKRLDDSDTNALVETIRALQEIRDAVAPHPLAYRDVRLWRKLVQRQQERAQQKSDVSQAQTAPENHSAF
jgi:hypothetical protein